MAAITKNARVCEICGSAVETTSAGDLGCIACLIGTGLDAERDQSDTAFASGSDQLGAYTIDHHSDGTAWELGHGAMGITYRAIDKALDRPVALKIINTNLGSRSAEARERFMREARAAAALRHPNVATVYQFGIREVSGQFFYAMELVEGETLEERVRRLGPFDVLTTIDIALQVTAALEAAEERGLVHRDLKPGNLMLVNREIGNVETLVPSAHESNRRLTKTPPHRVPLTVKVIDFGVSKAVAEKTNAMSLTHGGFVGTPAFASPEQFTNAPVDVRSDIYSLGVTLWFLLTGHMLFSGRSIGEIQEKRRSKPLPVDELKATRVPSRFVSLLVSMLAIQPAARPTGARELSAKLQAIRASISRRGKTAARLVLAAAFVALAAVVAVREFHSIKATPSVIPEKSVAVLPFEDLSDDPDSAYFAEGIQEEILTRLASIAELKVISRNSTQRYHSKPRDLGDIAKQLGVANILEGSVQKAGDQVRVNVQLINAQTDSHLWAETYDRKLTDILEVETEVAKRIADSLQTKLTRGEDQALAVKPTNNPEAYDAYLRGLALDARSLITSYSSVPAPLKAADFYERAVQLDPNFATAWARLSRAHSVVYPMFTDATTAIAHAARRDAAKRALENAQKLEPNAPETLLALGYYQFWVLRHYRLAKATFSRVSKMLPGSSDVPYALGQVARHEGNWNESVGYFEQALTLDPRNVELLFHVAWTYSMLRQFPAALKLFDRALDITPNDPDLMAFKACVYQGQGNLPAAAQLLVEANAQTKSQFVFRSKITQLRLERNYEEAIRLLQTRLTQAQFDSQDDKGWHQVALALMRSLAGDAAGAKTTAEQARNALEQLFRDKQSEPWLPFLAAWLSQAYAVMGEKDSALKEAERAIVLVPPDKTRHAGPGLEENLALIYAMFGENGRVISTLTKLLQTPYNGELYNPAPVTPALLRLDPFWDSLRGDPAFRSLCEEHIDKSIAVLPFENLSADPDNAYFARGIREEIITRLAGIGDLKVISRASMQRYQSKPRDLVEIAKQLGAANILEGIVQKAGDQVRVNVRLVNAQTDSHLWAETYDHKFTDILAVENEIAKRVADSLQAKLTGREAQALAIKPTNNPEAYDAYLRGLAFEPRLDYSRDAMRQAIVAFERVVQLDPNFATAWARLARSNARLYLNDDMTSARRDAAKRALENAQKLEPSSAETLLALGYYQFWISRDYGPAKAAFGRVSKLLPTSSEVPHALALIARCEGHWDQSIAYFEQALALDPLDLMLLMDAAENYGFVRQFPAALHLYDRVLDIVPNDPSQLASKAVMYQAEGNLKEAAKLLLEITVQTPYEFLFVAKITQLRLERNYAEAIRLLQARQAQFHFGTKYDKALDQVVLALMQRLSGDTAGAKLAAEQARNTLEQLYREQPNSIPIPAPLSQAHAVLGERDSALTLAERAVMLLPNAKNSVYGPALEENLALIQTMFGDNSRAISILTRLLQTPYGGLFYGIPVTPALLRLDPIWDPLRSDPAFQKLCEEKQPVVLK